MNLIHSQDSTLFPARGAGPVKKKARKTFRTKCTAILLMLLVAVLFLTGCQKKPNRMVRQVYRAGSRDDKVSFAPVRQFDGHRFKLDHVDYRVLSEKVPPMEKTEALSGDPDAYRKGDVFTIDGSVYRVEKVSSRSVPVTTDMEITSDEPVSTMDADYQRGNQKATLKYRLISEEWVKADSFPIQIVGYGGPYYQIGDIRLSSRDPIKDIKKQRKAVLTADGLDPRVYQITDARWKGPTYEDAAGNTCRDITVACKKHVAHYSSTVYDYTLLYSSAEEDPNRYQMQATAVYTPDDSVYERQVETVLLCLAGMLTAVVLFLLIRRQHRKLKPVVAIGDRMYSEDDF